MDVQEYIKVSGTVETVIYQNEENGYTVVRMEGESGQKLTAVGCLPFAAPGEQLILTGSWTRHQTHGEQFRAEWAQRIMPTGAKAIYEYLAGRAVKGIGPATATLIVSRFGDGSLEIIENYPEKLAEIRGLSMKKAMEISENFRRQAGLRRIMEFLNRYSIRPQLAMRVYKFYGDASTDVIRENPYILAAGHIGATFSEADALGLSLGFDSDCAQRIAAAVLFELGHNANNGHTFIPREKLIAATAQLIEVDEPSVVEGLDVLLDSGEVIQDRIAGRDGCYLAMLHEAELYAAERLFAMSAVTYKTEVDTDEIIRCIELEQGITYAPNQRRTLETAARRQLMAITGGPGTGKTTCVRAIIALFDNMGLETVLTAPTGRAAKRMSELTGKDASTVHRLLEAGFSIQSDELVFRKCESDPLKCGAVILDECSMVDITLLRALLAAMPETCRLVLVGDCDQLPSVGPGNVFLDILRSGVAQTVRLTEIFRQTQQSRIVTNAHMINRGETPNLSENSGDFFFLRRKDPANAVDTIVELCKKRLPEKMGFDPMSIQVLTPTRRYDTGTVNLNARLQQALNPPAEGKRERRFGEKFFREGDRIMQIRNNYDIIWIDPTGASGTGVFNGDIGKISRIDEQEELLDVDFDDRRATYSFEMLSELEHAYAMTVHKSQGSEYSAVILSVSKGPKLLMHRSVLYTAVTRARDILIVVGDDEMLGYMVDNYRQTRRYSGLRARLADMDG